MTDRLYRTTDRLFYVVECERCRLIRLDPRPTPGELTAYYPTNYWFDPAEDRISGLAEFYRRFVIQDHVRFALAAAPGPGSRFLDVGCGGGLFLSFIQQAGHHATGLDNSRDAARLAWRRHRVPAFCGMLPEAPFRPGTFDVVTLYHVLEHLYDPAAYIEAAHRLLRPGGRLILQVPNAASLQFILLGEHWNGLDVPRHLYAFRPDDLEVLLDCCGFEIVRTKHFSLRDNPAGLATSIAPGLDPMARRVRGIEESGVGRMAKNLAYLGLVIASTPFALLEAACRAGATIMLDARKKP
jgi:SAM-dependent methyltransferase